MWPTHTMEYYSLTKRSDVLTSGLDEPRKCDAERQKVDTGYRLDFIYMKYLELANP